MCVLNIVFHLNVISLVHLLSLFGELNLIRIIIEKLQLSIKQMHLFYLCIGFAMKFYFIKKIIVHIFMLNIFRYLHPVLTKKAILKIFFKHLDVKAGTTTNSGSDRMNPFSQQDLRLHAPC